MLLGILVLFLKANIKKEASRTFQSELMLKGNTNRLSIAI